MTAYLRNVSDQIGRAYHWTGDTIAATPHQVAAGIHQAKDRIVYTYHTVNEGCHNAAQSVKQGVEASALKAKDFVSHNKETLFFVGCTLATAYFAPALFFPTLIITIICRVELTYHLKKLADKYMKDELNPYKLHPKFETPYIGTLDLTLATVAAVDAIALGTFFVAGSMSVAVIPALGGIAAGNCLAKWGMNTAYSIGQ